MHASTEARPVGGEERFSHPQQAPPYRAVRHEAHKAGHGADVLGAEGAHHRVEQIPQAAALGVGYLP